MKYFTTKESYAQVFEIINFLDEEYKKKLPKKLYEFFEKNKDRAYKSNFTKEDVEKSNYKKFSRKTIAIIAFLKKEYWVEDEEEIKKLSKIYPLEQERFKEEVIQSFDDEVLCNSKPSIDTEENIFPIFIKKRWYKQLYYKIISIFNEK